MFYMTKIKIRPKSKNYKYWTSTEELKLEELVKTGKISFNEIGKLLNRSSQSCQDHSSILGFSNNFRYRKYFHDENFWSEINPITAYFGGFSSADCSVRYTGLCGIYRLELGECDKNHLDLFKKLTKFTGNIICDKRKNRNTTTVKIAINGCNKWMDDLKNNFAIIPNKTKRLEHPNIESNYLKWCWLIGFMDGDGCINLNPKNYLNISYTSSSTNLLFWIKDFIENKFNNKFMLRNRQNKIKKLSWANCHQYVIGGTRACALFNYLKDFPVPKLARKWQQPKILEYLEQMKQKYPQFFTETLTIPPEWQDWNYKKHYNLEENPPDPKINLISFQNPPNINVIEKEQNLCLENQN